MTPVLVRVRPFIGAPFRAWLVGHRIVYGETEGLISYTDALGGTARAWLRMDQIDLD
jgi:hypothetical protein